MIVFSLYNGMLMNESRTNVQLDATFVRKIGGL